MPRLDQLGTPNEAEPFAPYRCGMLQTGCHAQHRGLVHAEIQETSAQHQVMALTQNSDSIRRDSHQRLLQ